MANKWLNLALRLAFGALFLYSSATKLLNPQPFADAVANYRILPESLVNLFALVIIWLQFVVGVFLILGTWAKSAALLTSLMLFAFTIAIWSAVARGLNIECGCFSLGQQQEKVSYVAVAERAALFLLSLIMMYGARNQRRTSGGG